MVRPAILLAGVRGLFWVALVVTLAAAVWPEASAPHLFPWDKADHFAAFFVLTTLAAAAFPRTPLLVIALWLSLAGSAIELVQAVPAVHRDCDIWDWVADAAAIGAALGPVFLGRWRDGNATRRS